MSTHPELDVLCPKCRQPKAVILSPITGADSSALIYRCAGCSFQWMARTESSSGDQPKDSAKDASPRRRDAARADADDSSPS